MSAAIEPVKQWTSTYSTPEVLGMMTIAMIIALVLIALSVRLVRTMSAVRKYEAACVKVKAIEEKLEEMKNFMAATELEYERNLAELTRSNTKEFFELQQIVFARNGEIIELKNKLLKFNLNGPI